MGSSYHAWFNDFSHSEQVARPFHARGADCNKKTEAGVFAASYTDGNSGSWKTFRITLPGAGIASKDTTRPVMAVSPGSTSTTVTSVNAIVNITDPGYSAGLAGTNSYKYYLSPSDTSPTAEGSVSGTYENNKVFNIGAGLSGTYYLYIQQVFDNVGNGSQTSLVENGTGYYQAGPYKFGDIIAPNVNAVVTSDPSKAGFTVTIDASDNNGGWGLADTDAYTIYYKTTGESSFRSITTSSNTHTFTDLTASVEKDQANAPLLKEGMNPEIWVDLNGNGTIEEATEEIVKYSNLSTQAINPAWIANDGDNRWSYYNKAEEGYEIYATVKDRAGNISSNSGIIQENLFRPDHKTSHFGNVRMEDGSYFVWIPRYAYKITKPVDNQDFGTIDIKFINGAGRTAYDGTTCTIATANPDGTPNNIDSTTQYVVHPAFCSDVNMGGFGEEQNGIWVAKYETSQERNGVATVTSNSSIGNVVVNSTIKEVSKPDRSTWRNSSVGNMYTNGYNYNRSLDSHMMKNSEWGAVVYLTHSTYGRNRNEVSMNNSTDYYTGRSAGVPGSGWDTTATPGSPEGTYRYNIAEGKLANTTGNIYGIYDMAGGTWEYTAAWDSVSCTNLANGSNFASAGGKSSKYATAYTGESISDSTIENCILGDASYETKRPDNYYAWFWDWAFRANSAVDNNPFFVRGGSNGTGSVAGIFTTSNEIGIAWSSMTFRICLSGIEDKTKPVITVSPTTTTSIVTNTNVVINVSDPGYSDGLADNNNYKYYLSPSDTNPTANGYVSGNYTSGKAFNIGNGLTGNYYLYIQQIFDKAGNGSTTNNTTAGVNYYKVGPYKFDSLIADGSYSNEKGVNTPYLHKGLNPVIWVNGTEIRKYTDATNKTGVNSQWIANNGDAIWYDYKTGSGDHKQSRWANAVDTNGSYYVWIPRYAYKITSKTTDATKAGTIDVKFVPNKGSKATDGTSCTIATSNIDSASQYIVHPAFCADVNMGGYGQELSGIWMAKYEACNVDSKPVSKPNTSSWRTISVGDCYTNSYNYARNMDSHLFKNSEWGAVAYLTHSKYGRNANEISINNSTGFYTGRSAGVPGYDGMPTSAAGTYEYNTTEGMLASTTGNIYGVYDMSGGAFEFAASFNKNYSGNYFSNYGSSFASYNGKSTKYATAYNGTSSRIPTSNNCILGDTAYEFRVNTYKVWFNDYAVCADSTNPFSSRGSYYGDGCNAGIFYMNEFKGEATWSYSFRVCLPGV